MRRGLLLATASVFVAFFAAAPTSSPNSVVELLAGRQRSQAPCPGARRGHVVRHRPADGSRSQAGRRRLVAPPGAHHICDSRGRGRPVRSVRLEARDRRGGDGRVVEARGSRRGRSASISSRSPVARRSSGASTSASCACRGRQLAISTTSAPTGCSPTLASSRTSRTSSTSCTTTGRQCSTTTSAARHSSRGQRRRTAGLAGIAFVWTKSLCGGDIGAGGLNAAVAVHELIHGLGSLQGRERAERVCAARRRPRLRRHDGRPLPICEQPDDDLRRRRSTRAGTTTTAIRWRGFDVQDSGWLTHLPQQRLSVTIQTTGTRTGVVRLTSPTSFECAQSCTLDLDQGLAATLVAAPRAGAKLRSLDGRLHGQRLVRRDAQTLRAP